jgi:hypothetical protein
MDPAEDALRVLLRSPALALEPPTTLPDAVRRRAGRHRLRTRAAGVSGVALLAVTAALLAPSLHLFREGLPDGDTQPAEFKPDPRFPAATTDVVTMQRINGAEVLTWFEGARWCTATTRQTTKDSCLGPANPQHKGFGWVMAAGSASLTVDDAHVVAGLVPPGASRVVVHMRDGRDYRASVVDSARFVVPVWSVRVDDRRSPVAYYVAFDSTGREIARQPA